MISNENLAVRYCLAFFASILGAILGFALSSLLGLIVMIVVYPTPEFNGGIVYWLELVRSFSTLCGLIWTAVLVVPKHKFITSLLFSALAIISIVTGFPNGLLPTLYSTPVSTIVLFSIAISTSVYFVYRRR